MNVKTWKLRQWVWLCVFVLVLVSSLLAYSVFVPKFYLRSTLQNQVQVAENQRQHLLATPVPRTPSETERNQLALLVPAELEQARFLQSIHEDVKKSGVVLKNIQFFEAANQTNRAGSAAGQTVAGTMQKAPAQSEMPLLQAYQGKLSIQGEYRQVRKFLAEFATNPRLVTVHKWSMKTEQQDLLKASKSPLSTGVAVGSAASTPSQAQIGSLTRDEVEKQLPADVKNDPLLQDLTPIFTETEFQRYAQRIRDTIPTLLTPHEKELANLRIQQGFNRYTAALLGQNQAESVFDQEIAHLFIPGTNPNIREVLGIVTPKPTPQSPPLPFVDQPDVSMENHQVWKTLVTLDLDFSIYNSSLTKQLAPTPSPISTYDPEWRTNPVEKK